LKKFLDKSPEISYGDNKDNVDLKYKALESELENERKLRLDSDTNYSNLSNQLNGMVIDSQLSNLIAESGFSNKTTQDLLKVKFSQGAEIDPESKKLFLRDGENVVEARQFIDTFKQSDAGQDLLNMGKVNIGGGAPGASKTTLDKDARFKELLSKPNKTSQEKLELNKLAREQKAKQ
jgi:hypothetical protein